jgi:hypothetical protein
MKRIPLIIIALLPLSLFSCKTKTYTASELPDVRITFGNGGGFVGALTEYILLENGQLFKRDRLEGPLEELPKVKKGKAKKIFAQLEEADFLSMERNAPGNMYRFMSCQTPTDSNNVTWGSNDKVAIDSRLDSLYKQCMNLIENNVQN